MKTRLWLGLAVSLSIAVAVCGGTPLAIAQERLLPESVIGSATVVPTPRPDVPEVFVAQQPSSRCAASLAFAAHAAKDQRAACHRGCRNERALPGSTTPPPPPPPRSDANALAVAQSAQ